MYVRLLSFRLAFVLAILSLSACEYQLKPMDPVAASRVRKIALLDAYTPEKGQCINADLFYASGGGLPLAGSVVATGVHAAAMDTPNKEFNAALQKDVNFPRMLNDELERALTNRGFVVIRIPAGEPSYRQGCNKPEDACMNKDAFVKNYAAIDAKGADAILDPVCWGLWYVPNHPGFWPTEDIHPNLFLAARLVSPDGKNEYYIQRIAFLVRSKDLPGHGLDNEDQFLPVNQEQFKGTWHDVFTDPKKLELQLRIATHALAERIAADISLKPK